MTAWQFVRIFLHRIWIGRFLSRKAGGLFCSEEKRKEALNSARELALVFNRLNQLHLTGKRKDSNGLMMSLFAINMAEVAANVLTPNELVTIYITSALRVKQSYPKYLKFFGRYYMSKAKHESTKTRELLKNINWAFNSYGYRYFVNNSFEFSDPGNEDASFFVHLGNAADPMSYVVKVSDNYFQITYIHRKLHNFIDLY